MNQGIFWREYNQRRIAHQVAAPVSNFLILLPNFQAHVKPKSDWDHKGYFNAMYGIGGNGKDREHQFDLGDGRTINYDVMSNIHYGYAGRRLGIPGWMLRNAHRSQIAETGASDPKGTGDDVSVDVGIKLADKSRGPLTPEMVDEAIRARMGDPDWSSKVGKS